MSDGNSNPNKDTMAEAERLSKAITQLFLDEQTPPETGVIALAVSIGGAIRQFSDAGDLERNLDQTVATIRRVATAGQARN